MLPKDTEGRAASCASKCLGANRLTVPLNVLCLRLRLGPGLGLGLRLYLECSQIVVDHEAACGGVSGVTGHNLKTGGSGVPGPARWRRGEPLGLPERGDQ